MRRIRLFVNGTAYLLAVVFTVFVALRVTRQLATGESPPVSTESAAFREYQEAKAAKRKEDWKFFSQLADEKSSNWSDAEKDKIQAGVIAWLDEGAGFELYFRRMTKEQASQMQENLLVLAQRWLGERIQEYGRSRGRRRRTIVDQDAERVIGLALIFGRLDGFGQQLNRGLNTMEQLQTVLGDPDGVLREFRVETGLYFQAIYNRINQWRQGEDWAEIRRRAIDY